jgi:hypothetical protein
MTWADLLWLPPLMLAIATVVGAAGRRIGFARAIRRAFLGLTLGVVGVAVFVRILVIAFA